MCSESWPAERTGVPVAGFPRSNDDLYRAARSGTEAPRRAHRPMGHSGAPNVLAATQTPPCGTHRGGDAQISLTLTDLYSLPVLPGRRPTVTEAESRECPPRWPARTAPHWTGRCWWPARGSTWPGRPPRRARPGPEQAIDALPAPKAVYSSELLDGKPVSQLESIDRGGLAVHGGGPGRPRGAGP